MYIKCDPLITDAFLNELSTAFGLMGSVRRLELSAYSEYPFAFLTCPDEFFTEMLVEALGNAIMRIGETQFDPVCWEIAGVLSPRVCTKDCEFGFSRLSKLDCKKSAAVFGWLKFIERYSPSSLSEDELGETLDYWRNRALMP